jgi:hypothetical protein
MNLPNYHIYLKLTIDGVTSKAFSDTTLPKPDKRRNKERSIWFGQKKKAKALPGTTLQSDILVLTIVIK